MLTLRTVTLGCKVNQYETEYVRQGLCDVGYRDARDDEQADLCIVNTCTVTNEGDSKSRQIIRRLARDNPSTEIIVMGCYATRAPDELSSLDRVSEVVTDKRELPRLLERFGVSNVPDGISQFGDRHRAYVKVQDGCYLRCSYCIIPSVRNAPYSRPMSEILDEIRRLRDNGYREVVFTGVHLGHFGVDRNRGKPKSEWVRLSHLLRHAAQIDGDFRIRLSSIEATELTRELIDTIGEFGSTVCPHLHVCLQSGSDQVLRRMRRRWPVRMFIDRCHRIQEQLEMPALTTDVVVGFPGETDEQFAETCRVAREIGFSKIHIFPFSPRIGTPAATMPEQIPGPVKKERRRQLAEVEAETRREYFRQLVGHPLQVLVESPIEGQIDRCQGTACRYAPVELSVGNGSLGQLVNCTPGALDEERLVLLSNSGPDGSSRRAGWTLG